MLLNVLVGSFSFLALTLFALWALQGVGRPIEARIRALARARQQGEGLASIPFQQRVVAPLIESIGTRVAALLPAAAVSRTEQRLVLAGQTMRPAAYYTLMVGVGSLMAGAYFLLVFAVNDGTPPALALLAGAIPALLGAYVIIFWLSSQARAR